MKYLTMKKRQKFNSQDVINFTDHICTGEEAIAVKSHPGGLRTMFHQPYLSGGTTIYIGN